jgi:chemotaxis protein methyltransferase CheR
MVCLADGASAGWDVRVRATDVCQSSLDRATAGVYRDFETRTVPPAYRTRFFAPVGTAVRVTDDLRRVVSFARLDLTADDAGSAGHDAIFCENVLIYYGPDARAGILAKLAAALAPGGYLFLGAVERIGVSPPGLDPVRLDDLWMYRRPT